MKLNTERCRKLISQLRFERDNGGMSNQKFDYLDALEIALPILEQQEWGEGGWIEWDGSRGLPPDTMPKVEIKRRDGLTRVHYLHHCNWDHGRGDFDIIAYRIIPEQIIEEDGSTK